jgi:hypothetical protein
VEEPVDLEVVQAVEEVEQEDIEVHFQVEEKLH